MMSQLFEKYGDTIESDKSLELSLKECSGVMYAGKFFSMRCNVTYSQRFWFSGCRYCMSSQYSRFK